ncbi:MAG: hypothetical protein QM687_04270 [Ferruginibacter sp.]
MKKFYFLIFLFVVLLISSNLSAQNLQWAWSKSYGSTGNETGQKIAVDSRNGVYTFGTFNSSSLNMGSFSFTNNGGIDLFLCKHDTLGNLIWAKSFGSTGDDNAGCITTDRSGNIIIVGSFSNSITIGSYSFTSGGNKNIFVLKLDNAGNIIWAKHFSSTGETIATAGLTDYDNNIYIAGNYILPLTFGPVLLTPTNNYNIFYSKLDDMGNVVWAKTNSSAANYLIPNMQMLDSRRIILLGRASTGGSTPTINFNPDVPGSGIIIASPIAFNVKLDTAGNFISQKVSPSQGSLATHAISKLGNNHDIITAGSVLLLSNFVLNSLYVVSDSNFVVRSAATTNYTSNSAATALAYSNKRAFFAGLSTGYSLYGNGIVINGDPDKGYFYILEKDTSGTSKKIIYSSAHANDPGGYANSAVDTLTNSLYFTGSVSGNAVILNSDTLNGNGGNDILISKISINGYYFTLRDTATCLGLPVGIGINGDPSFGQGPYTYSWTPSTGLSDPNAARTYATPSTNTTYTLEITDALGSSITRSLTVTVNPVPTAIATVTASGPLASAWATV